MTRIDIEAVRRGLGNCVTLAVGIHGEGNQDLYKLYMEGLDALVAVVRTQVAAVDAEKDYRDAMASRCCGDHDYERNALNVAHREARDALRPFLPQPERAKDGGA